MVMMVKLLIGFVSLFFSVTLWAQEPSKLTSEDVERWVLAMQRLEPWFDEHQETLVKKMGAPQGPSQGYAQALSTLKDSGLYNDLNGRVKTLGYRDVEHWGKTSRRISFAWMAVKFQSNPQADKDRALYKQNMEHPQIPIDQKVAMEQQMSPSIMMAKQLEKVPEADKTAVKAHSKALEAHFQPRR